MDTEYFTQVARFEPVASNIRAHSQGGQGETSPQWRGASKFCHDVNFLFDWLTPSSVKLPLIFWSSFFDWLPEHQTQTPVFRVLESLGSNSFSSPGGTKLLVSNTRTMTPTRTLYRPFYFIFFKMRPILWPVLIADLSMPSLGTPLLYRSHHNTDAHSSWPLCSSQSPTWEVYICAKYRGHQPGVHVARDFSFLLFFPLFLCSSSLRI